jgi:hypothetical protein
MMSRSGSSGTIPLSGAALLRSLSFLKNIPRLSDPGTAPERFEAYPRSITMVLG